MASAFASRLPDGSQVSRGDGAFRSSGISLILFDLGGVVCKFLPERRLKQLAWVSGMPATQIRELLWDSGFSKSCDRGDLSGAEMHQRACELLGWTTDYAGFRRAWASAFEPDPGVLALVRALRPHCKTGLLTDNPPVIKEALRHELGEVGLEFDFIGFSCELRSLKPDPAIFRARSRALRPDPRKRCSSMMSKRTSMRPEPLASPLFSLPMRRPLKPTWLASASWPIPGACDLRSPASLSRRSRTSRRRTRERNARGGLGGDAGGPPRGAANPRAPSRKYAVVTGVLKFQGE